MSKSIKLKRKQVQNLAENLSKGLINESIGKDLLDFRTDVEVEIEHPRRYDGQRIYNVSSIGKMSIVYDLYMTLRGWGIDSIEINNVRGPRDIEVEIEVEPLTDDGEDTFEHVLQLDWSEYEVDSEGRRDVHLGIERVTLILDEHLFVVGITLHPWDFIEY